MRRRAALAAGVVGVLSVAVGGVGSAVAQTAPGGGGSGWQQTGPGTVTVGAGNGSGSPGSSGGGGGSSGGGGTSSCQWAPQATQGPNNPLQVTGYSENGSGPPTLISPTASGTWYLEVCPGTPGRIIFVPSGSPAPVVTPRMLASQAQSSLKLAAPALQMSPASSTNSTIDQFVNVPSWVWVAPAQWAPLSATAAVAGVTVTATAVPSELDLTYQDGMGANQTVKCKGPGTPYSDQLAAAENSQQPILAASPTCGWVWRHSSAGSADQRLQVTAQLLFNVSWTVVGAAGGGPLGSMASPTSTYRVMVGQIESVITGGS